MEDGVRIKLRKIGRSILPQARRLPRLAYGLAFILLPLLWLFVWPWTPSDTIVAPAAPEDVGVVKAAPYRDDSPGARIVEAPAALSAPLVAMPANVQIAAVASPARTETLPPQALSAPEEMTFSDTVRRGDTAIMILERAGVDASQAMALYRNVRKVYDLRRIHVGRAYHVHLDADGRIQEFTYEIDRNQRLVVTRQDNAFSGELQDIPYERRERVVVGELSESLYAALKEQGESSRLIHDFADIFAWSVDFATDLRQGDTFRLLIEEHERQGEPASYHRILAAELINRNRRLQTIYYQHSDLGGYYQPDGSSMKGMFLRSPLRYTRISSRFTMRRFHPILKRYRPHLGVDYAAPHGTPVHSVAAGTVIWAGRKGANGKMVIIRHHNAYKTYYLHLSRYAPGLRRNKRVTQGQIIGYVGSTGRSTGPHLDFRLAKNGTYLNPLKHRSMAGPPVPKKAMASFRQYADSVLNKLQQVQLALQHEANSEPANKAE